MNGNLGSPHAHTERELERALTERVGAFLQEMGNMFAFVGIQYKIQVESASSSSTCFSITGNCVPW